jgi:bifunctional DNA-binding transcriptional regulator/antitoxin component of YhaV-PrlF toxin-antitoxin module
MATAEKLTAIVSAKGEISLPAAILKQRRWKPGTQLAIEDTSAGVLLKEAPLFPPTRPEDVYGSLAHAGPPKSLKEMRVRAQPRRKTKKLR